MQEVPLSYLPAPPRQDEAMPSKVTNLFLALMILQLLLYGYILVLELPPRLTKTLVQEALKLPPSSVASLLGCTSAASALSEAEASEAFALSAASAGAPSETPQTLEEEVELSELGHPFLDSLAQLNYSSSCPPPA